MQVEREPLKPGACLCMCAAAYMDWIVTHKYFTRSTVRLAYRPDSDQPSSEYMGGHTGVMMVASGVHSLCRSAPEWTEAYING